MKTPKTITELLSKRSRWTQGVFARNKQGNKCDAFSATAESFCLSGAARRVYGVAAYYDAQDDIWQYLRKTSSTRATSIPKWNDYPKRTFKEVKRVAAWIDANAKKLGLIQ